MIVPIKIAVLVVASVSLAWLTRRSIRGFRSHGLYRLSAWTSFLALMLLNLEVWFRRPWSAPQLISWVFLAMSIFMVVYGVVSLRRGRVSSRRSDGSLIGIEKTTALVSTGAYRYVRHPMYSSLLIGGLGVLLKDVSWSGAVLTAAVFVSAVLSAKMEEKENIEYFGDAYREYIERTRMFVPFFF